MGSPPSRRGGRLANLSSISGLSLVVGQRVELRQRLYPNSTMKPATLPLSTYLPRNPPTHHERGTVHRKDRR